MAPQFTNMTWSNGCGNANHRIKQKQLSSEKETSKLGSILLPYKKVVMSYWQQRKRMSTSHLFHSASSTRTMIWNACSKIYIFPKTDSLLDSLRAYLIMSMKKEGGEWLKHWRPFSTKSQSTGVSHNSTIFTDAINLWQESCTETIYRSRNRKFLWEYFEKWLRVFNNAMLLQTALNSVITIIGSHHWVIEWM